MTRMLFGIVVALVAATIATHAHEFIEWHITLPWGYVELGNNEISIVSTIADPPKIRLAAVAGGSMGGISFNRLRGDGRQEELALIQGKEDERYRGSLAGEITIHLRRPYSGSTDDAMVRVLTLHSDGLIVDVPMYRSQ